MSTELDNLLSRPDRGIGEARGVLARLFRKMMAEIPIDPGQANRKLQRYLDNPVNRIEQTSVAKSSARGNMIKALSKPDMSWKVFIKALAFIAPKSATFTVTLEMSPGRFTEHSITMNVNDEFDLLDTLKDQ